MPRHAGHHGANVPRGLQESKDGSGAGRFGRMFPDAPPQPLDDDAIDELLAAMSAAGATVNAVTNHRIPAGYTYLGQFVDHDITFDPTSLSQKAGDPLARTNFRTPRFDLDSVYGAGPADQPYLYEWEVRGDRGVKLLVGVSCTPHLVADDLPRNHQGRALIGDPRNDENLLVAQLHLLFILFHNKVVDHLREPPAKLQGQALFLEAQRLVRWHYQWIVVHDFLRRVTGRDTAERVLDESGPGGPRVNLDFYKPQGAPFIPFEFSGAVYRFGHSMVRDSYKVNNILTRDPLILSSNEALGERAHLNGFRALPPRMGIKWDHFFEVSSKTQPQPSFSIDLNLAPSLGSLPSDISAEHHPLARLNLMRAADLELPSGPAVAKAMQLAPLTGLLGADVKSEALKEGPPLWYYVLAEAQTRHGGEHLGPVGGRIVAEVLVGLLQGDANSYLRVTPTWRPDELLPGHTDFTMGDLVRFTDPPGPR